MEYMDREVQTESYEQGGNYVEGRYERRAMRARMGELSQWGKKRWDTRRAYMSKRCTKCMHTAVIVAHVVALNREEKTGESWLK